MDYLRETILAGMSENIHFSKKLKSQFPAEYEKIMREYPGNQVKEKLWNFCNDQKTLPNCCCGEPVKFSNAFKTGYNRFCSCKCSQRSPEVREAYKKTTLERWGVAHNFASKEIIEKKKKTWLGKYGVDNPAKDQSIHSRGQQTKIERYGEEWVKTSFQRNTQAKYGVMNWVQVPEFYEKFSEKHSNKKYDFPSGKQIHVQGYEPWAINLLLETFSEDDIRVHRGVPSVKYVFSEKFSVHYPDIYIPSQNKLIEVKSGYTFKSLYEKNIAKALAAVSQGFLYEFWIFDREGKLEVKEFLPLSNEVAEL